LPSRASPAICAPGAIGGCARTPDTAHAALGEGIELTAGKRPGRHPDTGRWRRRGPGCRESSKPTGGQAPQSNPRSYTRRDAARPRRSGRRNRDPRPPSRPLSRPASGAAPPQATKTTRSVDLPRRSKRPGRPPAASKRVRAWRPRPIRSAKDRRRGPSRPRPADEPRNRASRRPPARRGGPPRRAPPPRPIEDRLSPPAPGIQSGFKAVEPQRLPAAGLPTPPPGWELAGRGQATKRFLDLRDRPGEDRPNTRSWPPPRSQSISICFVACVPLNPWTPSWLKRFS